jgi:hypothetical protein
VKPDQALAFVKKSGIALESARGPVPSLAEAIAGEPIRGSWWGHRKAHQIFLCSRAIRESKEVLVCRLVGGKVTYVHRRLWPALVRLHDQFRPKQLAAIREIHTAEGKHKLDVVAFQRWVPPEVMAAANALTAKQAGEILPIDKIKLRRR